MDVEWPSWCYSGDAPSEVLEPSPQPAAKLARKRRLDRTSTAPPPTPTTTNSSPVPDFHHNNNNNNNNNNINTNNNNTNNNNNNNHVKNERLSPGTPDLSSRSRSVTPSSVSHPDTPPAADNLLTGRNYSDFMRSLAAKYNNTNPNDYFSAARNGFAPPLDPRFKPSLFPPLTKDDGGGGGKKADFAPLLNPFANPSMFTPLIDMSSTQNLLALVRTAKEAEIQRLLKNVKRQDASSPLDLSSAAAAAAAAAATTPTTMTPSKRPKMAKTSASIPVTAARLLSDSPKLHEDVSHWTVDDVCNFILGIDICAEYAQTFRDQRIDGAGLPLLTEEHLTTTMSMKLGPALKLRSILAKKLGSCSVCLHCTHCHSGSPEPGTTAGNTSDSCGAS